MLYEIHLVWYYSPIWAYIWSSNMAQSVFINYQNYWRTSAPTSTMPLKLSNLTLEEALRSYSSVKGHRTRVEKEIGNLLRLLKDQYSATSEERINDRLDKLEKHTQIIWYCGIPRGSKVRKSSWSPWWSGKLQRSLRVFRRCIHSLAWTSCNQSRSRYSLPGSCPTPRPSAKPSSS